MLPSVCGSSKLVSTLVRVLSQPTFEHPGHGGECSGPSWQEAVAALGELWHHLPGVCVAPPGDSVLRGFDPWWVAPTLWLGLLQPPVILAHGLCGLRHLLPSAIAEILPKARLWGNIPLTFAGKKISKFTVSSLDLREHLFIRHSFGSPQYFFHHRNNMDIGDMIKEAYRIMDSTPPDIHPKNMLSDFTPLTKGQYPVFNAYPEFIAEYQSRKREKIRLKEMEHLFKRCVRMENWLVNMNIIHLAIWLNLCTRFIREEFSAPFGDFMRRKAEEEAFYTQVHVFDN